MPHQEYMTVKVTMPHGVEQSCGPRARHQFAEVAEVGEAADLVAEKGHSYTTIGRTVKRATFSGTQGRSERRPSEDRLYTRS